MNIHNRRDVLKKIAGSTALLASASPLMTQASPVKKKTIEIERKHQTLCLQNGATMIFLWRNSAYPLSKWDYNL